MTRHTTLNNITKCLSRIDTAGTKKIICCTYSNKHTNGEEYTSYIVQEFDSSGRYWNISGSLDRAHDFTYDSQYTIDKALSSKVLKVLKGKVYMLNIETRTETRINYIEPLHRETPIVTIPEEKIADSIKDKTCAGCGHIGSHYQNGRRYPCCDCPCPGFVMC